MKYKQVDISHSVDKQKVILNPNTMVKNCEYQIRIPSTVKNNLGTELGEDLIVDFTTENPFEIKGIKIDDENIETVLIKVSFTNTVDSDSTERIVLKQDGDSVDSSIEVSGSVVKISCELEYNTEYTLCIPGYIMNTDNQGLGDKVEHIFTTREDI